MDYNSIKKIDEESLKGLQEGSGPIDQCICHLFTSPEKKKGFGSSIKKALGSIVKPKNRASKIGGVGGRSVVVPLNFNGKGGVTATRRALARGSCGKCGCDDGEVVMKDTDLKIRITTADISSVCSCPYECFADKTKLQDNIKVVIEHSKVPDVPSSWNANRASGSTQPETRDQQSSTLGQTRSIQPRLDYGNSNLEAEPVGNDDREVTDESKMADVFNV